MYYSKPKASFILLPVFTLALSMITASCQPSEATTALDSALKDLIQNKNLAEQFVRDIKTTVDPSEPSYAQVMQDYEAARSGYQDFLNSVKLAAVTNQSHADSRQLGDDARTEAAEFFMNATKLLRPTMETRAIPFQRAIVLPENLTQLLQRLPKRRRSELIQQFENQIRWQSWRAL